MPSRTVTVDGKIYEQVTITKTDAERVYFLSKDGGGSVLLSNLTPEYQKKFGYDPNKAAAAAKAREKAYSAAASEYQKTIEAEQAAKAEAERPRFTIRGTVIRRIKNQILIDAGPQLSSIDPTKFTENNSKNDPSTYPWVYGEVVVKNLPNANKIVDGDPIKCVVNLEKNIYNDGVESFRIYKFVAFFEK